MPKHMMNCHTCTQLAKTRCSATPKGGLSANGMRQLFTQCHSWLPADWKMLRDPTQSAVVLLKSCKVEALSGPAHAYAPLHQALHPRPATLTTQSDCTPTSVHMPTRP